MIKNWLRFFFLFVSMFSFFPPTYGAEKKSTDPKTIAIRKLLAASHANEMGNQVVQMMVANMKAQRADISDAAWKELEAEIRDSLPELNEMQIPIWSKHYTLAEINQLISFYESPIGKKMLKVQPDILKEMGQGQQRWNERLQQRVAERLEKKGLLKSPSSN